jgi:hypothetical protein
MAWGDTDPALTQLPQGGYYAKQDDELWLARTAFATMVAGVMLAVGPQYAAAIDCPEPNAGTCPPLEGSGSPKTGDSCPLACDELGWHDGGSCVGPCCTCFM